MPHGRIATPVIHVVAEGVSGRDPAHVGFIPAADGRTVGRELSAMRNVARVTVTTAWQRGHFGLNVLPLTPSRYESGASQ